MTNAINIQVLRNITFCATDRTMEFDEVTPVGPKHRHVVLAFEPQETGAIEIAENGEFLLECQIEGDDPDLWYYLHLQDQTPDGRFARGFMHEMKEPRALLDLLAHRQRWSQIGRAAAMMTHEVRQPLFVVSLVAERAQMDLKNAAVLDREKLIEDFVNIHASVRKAQAIISQMSRYARSASAASDPGCNPLEVIMDIMNFHATVAKRDTIRLVLDHNWPEDGQIRVSDLQLGQVVTNLINNAYDSIRERQLGSNAAKGLIRLTLNVTDDGVELLCTDNGIGIPSTTGTELLFKPFVSSKKAIGNSGLGLYITRRILKTLGGQIEHVQTTDPGATFRVTLPSSVLTQLDDH